MYIRINDLGANVKNDGKLYSIGCTSILLEWMEENNVLYRILLDCGLKNTIDENYNRILDISSISRIKDIIEDKVLGYESGIQALALSHCHQDHVGGYPWFYQYCKDKGIRTPPLYMTGATWKQFVPFQNELYDIFSEPTKGTGFEWDKGIINEIGIFKTDKNYHSTIDVIPKPKDFEIKIRFIPAGHIVGSAMIEIDTIRKGLSLGKILYTGDTCFRDGGFLVDPINQNIIKDSYKAIIMEGTYIWNRPDEFKKLRMPQLMELLKDKIINTMGKGGNLVLLVYGIDRTANIMVALREIIDENKTGIDFRGKVFLDTKIGGIITSGYEKEFESFVKFENPIEDYSYFRKALINRYKDGLGPSMLQLEKDKSSIYQYVGGMDHRKDIIEKFRNGSCIMVATSATLEGGTALIRGSYMHPDGWGSDKKHLFLIVGGAIPGIMASRALRQYRQTEKDTGDGYADVVYSYYEIIDGKYLWFKEKLIFRSMLEDLNEFSAHANYDELVAFKQSVNSEKFIITHIGGHNGNPMSSERTQMYINDTFMSGLNNRYKQGMKLQIRNDIAILDGKNKIIVDLNPDEKTLNMDKNTYNLLRIKCIKDKGDYSHTIACGVIRRLITEDDKRNNMSN